MKRSLSLALLGLLLFSGTAFAVKPPYGSPSIIVAAGSQLYFGGSVTFDATYPHGTHNPWISLTCSQNGELVYGEGGTADHVFVLGGASSQWVRNGGGPASCYAELGDLYWRGGYEFYTFLASTTFDATG